MPKKITIMQNLIALAKPEFVTIPYTGDDGCYVSVKPRVSSISTIVDACGSIGIETDISKLHVTLMYCKQKNLPPSIEPKSKELDFIAWSNEIKHWSGHDGKTYIVMYLISPDLLQENARLSSLGLTHSFPVYSPHVTLTSDVPVDEVLEKKIKEYNESLAPSPLRFVFSDWTISSIKPD